MLLPLIIVFFPLIKLMPPFYSWQMRARVYRWYRELLSIEELIDSQPGEAQSAEARQELRRIESEVRRVRVPLSFSHHLYHLRSHIDLGFRAP